MSDVNTGTVKAMCCTKIEEYILVHNSVEGCDILKENHIQIFDTAIGDNDNTINFCLHWSLCTGHS